MVKAVVLLSGGLDSILATKIILEQDIEVEAINFLTVFCTCSHGNIGCLAAKSAADKLGIKLKVFEVSKEYLEILKNPKYGYGSQLNPCLDCRIFMFKKAYQYMKEVGAKFLITGEVLSERPMSQTRKALEIIERDTGLKGLILRPLSAKLLEPTIPEKQGLVDREKLLTFSGRSRKPQIQLARKLGIKDYPCPAGGCLLTDPRFAKRMRDLMRYNPGFDLDDVKLLKLGRHFRISTDAKLIIGRNEQENEKILSLAQSQDLYLYPKKLKGPVGIGRGKFSLDLVRLSAKILARYCDRVDNYPVEIAYKTILDNQIKTLFCFAFLDKEIEKFRI